MIFGRAGEEIEALRKAGIQYEIVPGVTSVLGAAAVAEIPLTHRRASSALVLITAHQAANSDEADWSKLVGSGATVVIYMGWPNYSGDINPYPHPKIFIGVIEILYCTLLPPKPY